MLLLSLLNADSILMHNFSFLGGIELLVERQNLADATWGLASGTDKVRPQLARLVLCACSWPRRLRVECLAALLKDARSAFPSTSPS
jgi:hypothetical protein